MSERGMKKWLPYKSLDKQSDYLKKMAYEKGKKEKPSIAMEEAESINKILSSYHGQEVSLSYFEDGYIHEEKGIIKKISIIYKYLILNDIAFSFSSIVSLQDGLEFDFGQ